MKKIFLMLFLFIFVCTLTGCKKYNENTIKRDLEKDISSIKGYHVIGDLQIYNGDNTYRYNIRLLF